MSSRNPNPQWHPELARFHYAPIMIVLYCAVTQHCNHSEGQHVVPTYIMVVPKKLPIALRHFFNIWKWISPWHWLVEREYNLKQQQHLFLFSQTLPVCCVLKLPRNMQKFPGLTEQSVIREDIFSTSRSLVQMQPSDEKWLPSDGYSEGNLTWAGGLPPVTRQLLSRSQLTLIGTFIDIQSNKSKVMEFILSLRNDAQRLEHVEVCLVSSCLINTSNLGFPWSPVDGTVS